MLSVLLLGADPATVFLFRTYFERVGLSLVSSEIVEPLEDLLLLGRPAALILALNRTNKEAGEKVLHTIRSRPEFQNLPVFSLSGGPWNKNGNEALDEKTVMSFQS